MIKISLIPYWANKMLSILQRLRLWHQVVASSLAKTVGNHIKNIYKQLFFLERSLHKQPANQVEIS